VLFAEADACCELRGVGVGRCWVCWEVLGVARFGEADFRSYLSCFESEIFTLEI
jgi:hypothetical protein